MKPTDKITTFYKLRAAYDRLSQLTWTIRNAQERFPVGDPENEEQLLKIYIALILDVEDILQELKQLKENVK